MEYDKDKVDEMTLALLYLVMSREGGEGKAWRGFDWNTMERLHQKGWISDLHIKSTSVRITTEGVKKAEDLFRQFFQNPSWNEGQ